MRRFFRSKWLFFFILAAACNRGWAPIKESRGSEVITLGKDTLEMAPEVSGLEDSLLLPLTEPRLMASLKHTPCYGHCPVYEVQFYSNGQALYKGLENVPLQGIYLAIVPDNTIREILEKAREIRFFQLSDFYPLNGRPIADLPQVITYLNDGRREKTIVNNHLAPVELINFERFLDKLAMEISWQPKVE
ncbi:MAG: hypothetical protein KDD06_29615 [Phaeodactylibacter sp.]|nr:hypothetical protein [Phaeodactylibacter sp.]